MRSKIAAAFIVVFAISCTRQQEEKSTEARLPVTGTWKLLSGTLIENGDTTVTDYTRDRSFIKIINDSHFAFLHHGFKNGKDSAVFAAGGGAYTLRDSTYTEHLEYCNARDWEGHDFSFTISIHNDTLVQQGTEKIAGSNVDRYNIERYVRVKTPSAETSSK
ncbi:hypothetical protein [Niabella drilacis]|uniref:Lipocalin-like domain-containing protein n=1 Tax=Niabella drilacis (strain DSM 25811 / CCM 8410 / CCUG 62505 / LMG 26954 / E90) TaxID=1285928 RepID=A0A1G6WCS0_NIADE|nr:hypothetical protein [Niabella drilacis]SDD63651.1 hypothetical protein SAMN04487894_11183 [Niabella drilacis]